MLDPINYIWGCCEFRAEGCFPERFLNLAARSDAGLFDIRRTEKGIRAKVAARRYRTLRPIAKKCRLRMRVVEKYGLPFRLLPYRRRAGMPLGFLLFCGIIWLLGQFYWIVELPQVSPGLQERLEQAVYDAGIRPGVLRSQVDGAMTAAELQLELPELSWAGVVTKGSRISVDVRELEQLHPVISSDSPCNIVASRGGRIISVRAAEGQPAVTAGDTAAEGDLLISGVIELASGDVTMVHSHGEVMAETYYSFTAEADFQQRRTERTGRVITLRRLMLLGIELPLWGGGTPEGQFERECEEWQLTIGGTEFPLVVRTERWYETGTVNRTADRHQAEAIVRQDMMRQLQTLGDKEIISQNEQLTVTESGVELSVTVTVHEDIARKELILTDEASHGGQG